MIRMKIVSRDLNYVIKIIKMIKEKLMVERYFGHEVMVGLWEVWLKY